MTDTASYERNRPATLTTTLSTPNLRAVARFLSARIARLLGVEEIPLEELAFVYAQRSRGGEEGTPAQEGTGLLKGTEAAGIYHEEPSLLDLLLDRQPGHSTIAIATDYGGWGEGYGDPGRTKVLVHELAHAYLLRNRGVRIEPWVQESMAEYVAIRLGYSSGLSNEAGDPVREQYLAGARFMLWLDERVPDAGLNWARVAQAGIGSEVDALESVTGTPTVAWLAAYYDDPNVEGGTGPLSRFLTIKSQYGPLGQKALERHVRRSEQYRARLHATLTQNAKMRRIFANNPELAQYLPNAAARYGIIVPPNRGENTTPTEERTTASDRVPIDYSPPEPRVTMEEVVARKGRAI